MSEDLRKNLYSFIWLFILLFGLFLVMNLSLNKVRDINKELYGVNQDQENIIFYENCQGYVEAFYNCRGERFQNLSGKYCDNVLVCQTSYKILR